MFSIPVVMSFSPKLFLNVDFMVLFSCTEKMREDKKINFSLIFCVFSYQKSCKTHNFNFFTGKYFLAKQILPKGRNFCFPARFLVFSCQQNTHKKMNFILFSFILLHFSRELIFRTAFPTTEQSHNPNLFRRHIIAHFTSIFYLRFCSLTVYP